MKNFGLYIIITKPVLSYKRIAEICVKNEIEMLQLREKHLPDSEIVKIGRKIKSVTNGTKTNFVINDRPDIAALCEADYLHLGQNDIDINDARKIIGNNIRVGISTHSVEQAKKALEYNPDYIGFGPIFPTITKAIPDPVTGTQSLSHVLTFANVPVVALGGIFPENINEVLKAGAKNVALVRYLMETKDLDIKIKELKLIIQKYSTL